MGGLPAFNEQGWSFIDSDSAYQDPMYQLQTETLPSGESILWNIAKIYGVDGLRYSAEDAPYEYENLKKFGLNVVP